MCYWLRVEFRLSLEWQQDYRSKYPKVVTAMCRDKIVATGTKNLNQFGASDDEWSWRTRTAVGIHTEPLRRLPRPEVRADQRDEDKQGSQ